MGRQGAPVEGSRDMVCALLEVDPQADIHQGHQDEGHGEPVDPTSTGRTRGGLFRVPTWRGEHLLGWNRGARFHAGFRSRLLLGTRFFGF